MRYVERDANFYTPSRSWRYMLRRHPEYCIAVGWFNLYHINNAVLTNQDFASCDQSRPAGMP